MIGPRTSGPRSLQLIKSTGARYSEFDHTQNGKNEIQSRNRYVSKFQFQHISYYLAKCIQPLDKFEAAWFPSNSWEIEREVQQQL